MKLYGQLLGVAFMFFKSIDERPFFRLREIDNAFVEGGEMIAEGDEEEEEEEEEEGAAKDLASHPLKVKGGSE